MQLVWIWVRRRPPERLRGGEFEPAVLVPIADLGVGATPSHFLESLAARAVGPDPIPAVGVAVPSLNHGAQAEVEAAAREAFADPLLVLRPTAVAAWFRPPTTSTPTPSSWWWRRTRPRSRSPS